jgi:pyruvate/2-oxoglutarate dehydrogenase complex dihydrolipoamide acyltransferase (E2) component
MKTKPDYDIIPFPKSRRLIVDAGRMSRNKHILTGLIEVDATEARRKIHEHKAQTGESLSFTAFLLACIGQAVAADRQVHAYRNWRNQLIVYNDVDALIAIEIELEGRKFPLVHVMSAVDKRSVGDIHDEIRAIQTNEGSRFIGLFSSMPRFVRDLLYWLGNQNPHIRRKYSGTVGFTSVGMFGGNRSAWGIGLPNHTLALIAGGIAEKPGVVDGRIEIREYLQLTLHFDHDIVDGAPAARFTSRLAQLIECAYGLDDIRKQPE